VHRNAFLLTGFLFRLEFTFPTTIKRLVLGCPFGRSLLNQLLVLVAVNLDIIRSQVLFQHRILSENQVAVLSQLLDGLFDNVERVI